MVRQPSIPSSGNWSAKVTQGSFALELEQGVFTWNDPKRIAQSLKRSADASTHRCQFLKLEEIRELPTFGASLRRSVQRCPCLCSTSIARAGIWMRIRSVFWNKPRTSCACSTARCKRCWPLPTLDPTCATPLGVAYKWFLD
jgi:hypothetical protein